MWLRLLGAIVLGVFLYIGSTLMFDNLITGTSQAATIGKQYVPVAIAVVTVAIAGMGIFHHE